MYTEASWDMLFFSVKIKGKEKGSGMKAMFAWILGRSNATRTKWKRAACFDLCLVFC